MERGEVVAEAVARAWPGSGGERPASTPVPEFMPTLLTALRELELAPPGEQDDRGETVMNVLRAVDPDLHRRVETELEDLLLASEWGTKRTVGAHHVRRVVIEVAYATDRRTSGNPGHYGGKRGELEHGFINASFADDARMCRIEKPRPWSFGFSRGQSPNLERSATPTATAADFSSRLHHRITGALRHELLVFVHGYNVTFDDAVLRTAQLTYDLNFRGVPLLFSWPANGRAMDYLADGENASWAQRDFREVVGRALSESGAAHVHIVAHSMGNRLLVQWLTSPEAHDALKLGPGRLGQVVFAAPDVDAGEFMREAPRMAGPALRRTLYVSARDVALNASKALVRNPRAGQAGFGVVVTPEIDTIDATDLDTGLMSHSYIGDNRSVVSDLYYLLDQNLAPADRFGLHAVVNQHGPFWKFRK